MPETATAFTATVHRTAGMAVIVLAGDLDRAATATLDDAVTEALVTAPGALGLDFARVPFVNSTGIALVVALLRRADASGTPVRVWGLSAHYAHIFRITRLTDHLTLYADESDARAASQGSARGTSDGSSSD